MWILCFTNCLSKIYRDAILWLIAFRQLDRYTVVHVTVLAYIQRQTFGYRFEHDIPQDGVNVKPPQMGKLKT